METVSRVNTRFEADLIAARLSEGGIPALVVADDVGGMVPFSLHAKGAQVQVLSKHVAEAEKILATDDSEE